MRKPVFRVLKKRTSNQSPQLQRLARNCSKSLYDTFQKASNIGADQSAQASLCLCCSQTPEDRFSSFEAYIYLSILMDSSIWCDIICDKTCLRGFPTKQDSNQSPQLQRLARILKFCLRKV